MKSYTNTRNLKCKIYDKSHKGFKEQYAVDNALQEIAETLNFIPDGMKVLSSKKYLEKNKQAPHRLSLLIKAKPSPRCLLYVPVLAR